MGLATIPLWTTNNDSNKGTHHQAPRPLLFFFSMQPRVLPATYIYFTPLSWSNSYPTAGSSFTLAPQKLAFFWFSAFRPGLLSFFYFFMAETHASLISSSALQDLVGGNVHSTATPTKKGGGDALCLGERTYVSGRSLVLLISLLRQVGDNFLSFSSLAFLSPPP